MTSLTSWRRACVGISRGGARRPARGQPPRGSLPPYGGPPAHIDVHELHAGLHDVSGLSAGGGVRKTEQPGSDVVLGVDDHDDITSTVGECRVQGLRLVLLLVVVDDDLDGHLGQYGGGFGD